MSPSLSRLSVHAAPLLVLLFAFAGGIFDGWFSPAENDVNPAAVEQALRATLTNVDSTGRVLLSGQRYALDPIVSSLYDAHDDAALWTTKENRRLIVDALASASSHGITLRQFDGTEATRLALRLKRLDNEAAEWDEKTEDPRPRLVAELDLLLTEGLVRYADALSGSRVDPALLFPGGWYAGTSSLNTTAVTAALRAGSATGVVEALANLHPIHAEYQALRGALQRLQIAKETWTLIPDGRALSPGERSIRVPYVRGRLGAFGYLNNEDADHGWDATDVYLFDHQLAGALSHFLEDSGLAADSTLSEAATNALNAELSDVIDTISLNLERWRWLPDDFGDMHVFVNLPSFELNVRLPAQDGNRYRDALTMPSVIGMVNAGSWTTPVMSDTLESIVFHPSWSVPRSIQATSLIPQARADSGTTLPMQGFDVYAGGAWVDPTMVDWDAALPGQYLFIQRPGSRNPMGRIKFVMPNENAIIIHDTPNRGNFSRPVRAFSNGCIHAGDARALATFLLGHTNGWNEENIDAALRRGGEWVVPLDRPVPVHLLYFTAWAEADGRLRIFEDVYGRDARVSRALESEES